jgi:hypothetical protein
VSKLIFIHHSDSGRVVAADEVIGTLFPVDGGSYGYLMPTPIV